MPYISAEEVKAIRNTLKKEFPRVKFSVTKEHCTNVHICILESDIDFTAYNPRTNETYDAEQINQYYIKEQFPYNEIAREFLLKLMDTIEKTHPQKDLYMDSDYGNIPNYYLSIRVGKWNVPYKLINQKAA